MGMIFSDHLSHYSGRLDMARSLFGANGIHGIDDPPVYRLETVSHIWKGSGNNCGKGVGKIAGFNFLMKNCLGNPHRQVLSLGGKLGGLHSNALFVGDF
jgi:hypothetical protein